jgi:Flp pilus assembly protein TadD
MNQSATALALLEENARQYPQSSGAAFDLGSAFRTAGDDAKARAEFQRALQLDPKNKRAQDALKPLLQPQAKSN